MKKITALLDIRNTGFPVEIQQIHLAYGDIAKPVQLALVPNDLADACSRLSLLPHDIAVCALIVVLFQDARDDR